MGGTGIIDQFLETFTRYIDSGFGLLGGEVGYLATTLAAIDVTLAGLFWSWGADEDILARLVKKTLFVGVFAFLIGNWNSLARAIFESFAGLGLKASGTSLSSADFLRPGKIAQVGLDAGRPILDSISAANIRAYLDTLVGVQFRHTMDDTTSLTTHDGLDADGHGAVIALTGRSVNRHAFIVYENIPPTPWDAECA